VGGGRGFYNAAPGASFPQLGGRLPSKLCSMEDLLKAFTEGRIQSYADVINMSR
jgi:hypothetical protein